jgi:peptidoglycan/LPS O-acetylase OafA/YrhL
MTPPSGRLIEIEALRSVAIIMVLIEHLPINLFSCTGPVYHSLFDSWHGTPGVDLFFAISGFVITRSLAPGLLAAHRLNRWRVVVAFWLRRFWRLAPAAWDRPHGGSADLSVHAAFYAHGQYDSARRDRSRRRFGAAHEYGRLPGGSATLHGLAGMAAYLILIGWMAASGAMLGEGLGVSIGTRWGVVAVLSGAAVFAASFDQGYVLGRGPARRFLVWLGTRSYSLYLVHMPTFALTREPAWRANLSVDGQDVRTAGVLFALATPITLMATALTYRYVDTPSREQGARTAVNYLVGTVATTPTGITSS